MKRFYTRDCLINVGAVNTFDDTGIAYGACNCVQHIARYNFSAQHSKVFCVGNESLIFIQI